MIKPDPRSIRQNRRGFFQTTTAAALATTVPTTTVPTISLGAEGDLPSIIDTNVALGDWPFRRTPLASTPALIDKLRKHGVTQAWACSLDAILHKDISSVNERLAQECKQHGEGFLVPIGAINPMLPGWEKDVRRCVEEHRMSGIRLHPNYHGYSLADSVFERVLQVADELGLLVQIAVVMEDERTIHPLINVPATDTTPLPAVLKKFKKVRLQLLNAFRSVRGSQVVSLAVNGVCFEIAMLEGVAGVAKLFEQVPLTSLCFGSYAPVFYFESARLKLQESVLAGVQMKAICFDNALRLIHRP
jgi:predicted TIM-barrel fold metal-dependent hydrolase